MTNYCINLTQFVPVIEFEDMSEFEVLDTVRSLESLLSENQLMTSKKWRGRTPVLKALFSALNASHIHAPLEIATLCLKVLIDPQCEQEKGIYENKNFTNF